MLAVIKALGLFVLAAVCEIGGAYLVWQWQRTDKPCRGYFRHPLR